MATIHVEPITKRHLLVAYVTPEGIDTTAAVKHLSACCPEYMVPSHFVTMNQLPSLPNGKINRCALPFHLMNLMPRLLHSLRHAVPVANAVCLPTPSLRHPVYITSGVQCACTFLPVPVAHRLHLMQHDPVCGVRRRALPVPELAGVVDEEDYIAPTTATQAKLQLIWQQVLGASDVSIDADFFIAGGNSLTAAKVISRTRTTFGLPDLPLSTIFLDRTIEGLAGVVDMQLADIGRASEPSLGKGPSSSRGNSFCKTARQQFVSALMTCDLQQCQPCAQHAPRWPVLSSSHVIASLQANVIRCF